MNKFIKKILLLSLILTIGSLAMVSTASATIWVIDDNASSTDIQNRINNASTLDGDTLSFGNGTMYNDINLVINKGLNLEGNGATLTNYNNSTIILNIVNTGNVVINNFIINGGRPIVANNVEDLTITNNVINMGTANDAISLTTVQGGILEKNTLNGNIEARDAIGIVNSSDISINFNHMQYFSRNGISLAAGFMGNGTSTSDISIRINSITKIGEEGIFFGGGVSKVRISSNVISVENGNGINIARSSIDISIGGNKIHDCYVGIRVEEGNTDHNVTNPTELINVTIYKNTFTNNYIAILLVNVVDLSWVPTLVSDNKYLDNTYKVAIA